MRVRFKNNAPRLIDLQRGGSSLGLRLLPAGAQSGASVVVLDDSTPEGADLLARLANDRVLKGLSDPESGSRQIPKIAGALVDVDVLDHDESEHTRALLRGERTPAPEAAFAPAPAPVITTDTQAVRVASARDTRAAQRRPKSKSPAPEIDANPAASDDAPTE